jgi:LCP family protein required for cell wall assembly
VIAASAARRRATLIAAFLVAWVAGSVLGAGEHETAGARPLLQIEPAHAEYLPVLNSEEPIFILVIGSDARPDQEVNSQRADSLHIVAVNPAKHKATILGFPRDSNVPIPDYGTTKINAALAMGGPELVVRTVEELTGLTMDYWAITGFDGFSSMVDQVDGLVVDVPFALDDPSARAFFEPGVQRLDGPDALALARDRHDLPAGDFGRSENQGLLMISALTQLRKEFTQDPSRLLDWIGAFTRNAESTVALDELMNLAFTGTGINHNKVVNIVAPGGTGTVGGLSVVTLDMTALQAISADLADDGLLKKGNIPPSPNAPLLGGE